MTKRQILLVFFLSIASGADVPALPVASSNPYRAIVLRNAFGLSPPRKEAVPPPLSPAPKVQLLGITTILPEKRAIVKIAWSAAPGLAAREQTLVLKSYQRVGEIEITEINERDGTVRMNISTNCICVGF